MTSGNMWAYALAQLTVKEPSIAAVIYAGMIADSGRAWYAWAAFLVAALCMNQAITMKSGKAAEKETCT